MDFYFRKNKLEPKTPSLIKLNVDVVVHGSLSHFDTFQLIITTNLEEVGDKKKRTSAPVGIKKETVAFYLSSN